MTIRLKLLLTLFSLIMLMLMMGLLFYNQLKMLSKPLTQTIPHSINELINSSQETDLIYRLFYLHVLINRNLTIYLLTNDIAYLQNYYENIELQNNLLDEAKSINSELGNKLTHQLENIMPKRNSILTLIKEGNNEGARKLINQVDYVSSINNLASTLNEYYNHYSTLTTETASVSAKIAEKNANTILNEGMRLNFLIFILVIITSLILAFIGAYTISHPINLLRKNMQSLSKNFNSPIDHNLLDVKGEIGALANSFALLIEKLRTSEKFTMIAEESNRLKSEFLSNISHELRTPLNGIKGFSELMLQDKQNQSKEQQDYLNNIVSSTKHLSQLIDDILDLSQIDSGRIELNPELINIDQQVKESIEKLKIAINEKNVTLTVKIDPKLKEIRIDSGRFKQVLYNYLSNAVKFTSTSGKILVQIIPSGNQYFLLEVADTGIGIADEDMPKLFQVFQQLDSGIAKKYQGTGLGLALTKRIVELQGGTVWVESVLGKGSSFFARLPNNYAPKNDQPPKNDKNQ